MVSSCPHCLLNFMLSICSRGRTWTCRSSCLVHPDRWGLGSPGQDLHALTLTLHVLIEPVERRNFCLSIHRESAIELSKSYFFFTVNTNIYFVYSLFLVNHKFWRKSVLFCGRGQINGAVKFFEKFTNSSEIKIDHLKGISICRIEYPLKICNR